MVDLPEAPGSAHRPAALVLPVAPGRPGWQLSGDSGAVAGLSVLLAALDLAPPGALVDLVGDDPSPALLAAVYSTRLVRAVAADGLVAHAARQAAASNALPLVVEERLLGGADGTSLDDYAAATGLEPAVVHIGAGVDPSTVLAGAGGTLTSHRPWIVVTGRRHGHAGIAVLPRAIAHSYSMMTERDMPGHQGRYVLAPDGAPAVFPRRVRAWAQVLQSLRVAAPAPVGRAPAPLPVDALDLRDADEPARPG